MKFVSEEELVPGQDYMIYCPSTRTKPSIGTFISKSATLLFRANGQNIFYPIKTKIT